MLRAMKFKESGLKCWPCQCNVVLSQTYSSRGDYLWNVNCPGNVTESRGGGEGTEEEHRQVPWVVGFHYPDSFFVYLCATEKK